jgi:hypothetical protein
VFHVANRCPFPVWPATVPNTGHPVLAGGVFLLPSRKSKRVVAPLTWNGRFWARTGCNFTSNSNRNGTAPCLTGDCQDRLACNGQRVHRAGAGSKQHCAIAGCAKDVNAACPAAAARRRWRRTRERAQHTKPLIVSCFCFSFF